MALGLGLTSLRAASLACLACSVPVPHATLASEEVVHSPPLRAESAAGAPSAPAEAWPAKDQLYLVHGNHAELVLRALRSPFVRQLASSAEHVLYDVEFELVWFSSAGRLWVIDLRDSPSATLDPVLIATRLPPHVELHVERGGTDFVEPTDTCDLAPVLELHWLAEPWIEGGAGQRVTHLEGRGWLERERSRVARRPGEERWLQPSRPHVALSTARARCEDMSRCGAALPFMADGRELVLTDQSEGADCWHFGCLFRDSRTGAFGTPPEPMRWGPADDMPSGPCGPYWFNAEGSAFLVQDVVCVAGASCLKLDGSGLGWLVPGAVLGPAG